VPDDAFDYGQAIWIEEYADSEFGARVGLGMFGPMIFAPMSGKKRDVDTARKTLTEVMPRFFDYFDGLTKGREFLVGKSFGIADISVATQLVNLHHAGGSVDPSRWPGLADYIQRMLARESFAASVAHGEKHLPPHRHDQ
jgi:glutathione S-transferase